MESANPLTITELNGRIQELLETAFPYVRVQGEAVSVRRPASGHVYFTVVDATSQIRAVIWRTALRRLTVQPADGQSYILTGRVVAYPPRGEYQLLVEGVQPAGAGSERERLLLLHQRLAGEGLFDASRKKTLPLVPETIGVVTSASGAALQDVLRVLQQRFPGFHVLVAHATVQGERAPAEIAAAIQALNHPESDGMPRAEVIICGRGGGSAEDLSAFNSEVVVRAIAGSRVPVISAVGHEIDTTLADLAADVRAPTPSAAAEMAMADRSVFHERIRTLRLRLRRAMQRQFDRSRHRLEWQQARIRHPQHQIDRHEDRLRQVLLRLVAAMRSRLGRERGRLDARTARLHALSPLGVLERGYALVMTDDGGLVRHVDTVPVGDRITVRVANGMLRARVLETSVALGGQKAT
jgi:exodeoxyribonuclease VII large subunit